MLEEDLRSYLELRIDEASRGMEGCTEFLVPMLEGSLQRKLLDPQDMQAGLSLYRVINELRTLLQVYNKFFDDRHIREYSEKVGPMFKEADMVLENMVSQLVDINGKLWRDSLVNLD